MLTGEYAAMGFLSPSSRGGTTVHIHLYVKDADALTERAFGHVWHLATHTEDLSAKELKKRAEKAMKA